MFFMISLRDQEVVSSGDIAGREIPGTSNVLANLSKEWKV